MSGYLPKYVGDPLERTEAGHWPCWVIESRRGILWPACVDLATSGDCSAPFDASIRLLALSWREMHSVAASASRDMRRVRGGCCCHPWVRTACAQCAAAVDTHAGRVCGAMHCRRHPRLNAAVAACALCVSGGPGHLVSSNMDPEAGLCGLDGRSACSICPVCRQQDERTSDVDLVTPAAAEPGRRIAERGFNQSALIAERVLLTVGTHICRCIAMNCSAFGIHRAASFGLDHGCAHGKTCKRRLRVVMHQVSDGLQR